MAEIVTLRGKPAGQHVDTPRDEKLVEYARDLLERAEAGEIVGLAYVHLNRDLATSGMAMVGTINETMIGEVAMTLQRLMTVRLKALDGG